MSVPHIVQERLAKLSAECGVALRVVKHWENEFRPGWLCWFRGTVTNSQLIRVELAGTLAIELGSEREDETDMFVFVNGARVGLQASPRKYLWRRGKDHFIWDDQDQGYEDWTTLEHYDDLERQA
jgi:hypothetical protein